MTRRLQTFALAGMGTLLLASCSTPIADRSGIGIGAPVTTSTPSQAVVKPVPPSDSFAPGDSVEIFVSEDSSFDGVYAVRSRGDVIIPKLGRINVAGMTASEVESKIKSSLESKQLNTATVIADRLAAPPKPTAQVKRAPDGLEVYLTGKVGRPGLHRIPKKGSVGAYEALLVAGGIARFGDERKAHILRLRKDGRRAKVPIDLKGVRSGTAPDIALQEHDIVVVPERVFGF